MIFSEGQSITPDQAMRAALEIAKEGRGMVSPNPLVGCVIVDHNHCFLAAAAHLRFGEAHAEINALSQVKSPEDLMGAVLYVTLEPCAHQGKTGSCAVALSKLPISRVCYASLDPNPLVSGKGVEILKRAGKEVIPFKKYERDALELAEQFFYHMKTKQPFIALKVAVSFDGKMALPTGESQWITGEEARLHGRKLRAHYDATMIGSGTFTHDNPTLDFRETSWEGVKNNKIIIVDPKGRSAAHFKGSEIAKKHDSKNIFILTREEFFSGWSDTGVQLVEWDSSKLAWQEALSNLYQMGVASIYVEGGSFVFSQMLQFGLAQKIYMFQAPKIIGVGMSWSRFFENSSLANSPQLKNWQNLPIGEDRLNIAYFK